MGSRWTFDGHIAGIGTTSGLRAVVGIWQDSPFGSFSDVMVQQPSGHRLLLAPTSEVAGFIAATYAFDEVRVLDVAASLTEHTLTVDAGLLAIGAISGARTFLGSALRAVPRRLAVHPRWLAAVNPFAALAAPGARTYGTAGSGRTEFYGVTDLHHVTSAVVRWNGADAGELAPIRPPVTFGFSSVPPRPSIARVRTTIIGASNDE
ncbi:hypothetical protein FBY30_2536 [Arthrobacter sp. SLBN-83]|uniref:hypothetical protein n=1 Tax=Arthrobacter sp. SLBN-83 TaxID=2768449 RepID=UPI001151B5B2|nr:hypothetical protein [Arthrobacter sp. SLBN-83]TQJ60273.1 hypothetical protein FBY30_2536 [Arthrobacter sp. SLBN-83]